MTDFRQWLHGTHRIRATASELAEILDVSRATMTRKLIGDELTGDEVVLMSRHFDVNPVQALVDLGFIEESEVFTFLDQGGLLIETAEDGELALELARRLNPASELAAIREIEARSNRPQAATSSTFDMPIGAVADSSDWHEEENSEFDD